MAEPDNAPASPPARRLRGPSWLDLRLIAGILLVLASVVVGARVIGAADDTVTVWAAARDLATGTTVRDTDVELVQVRLLEAATSYLGADADLTGAVLDRPVVAGELVPASALRPPTDRVRIALPVPDTGVPFDLTRGQLVDVYATGPDQPGAADVTRLVLGAAPVQAVDGEGEGVLSSTSGQRQVVVSVPAEDAAALLAGIAGRELALAILEDPTAAERPRPTTPAGTTTVSPTSAAPTGATGTPAPGTG